MNIQHKLEHPFQCVAFLWVLHVLVQPAHLFVRPKSRGTPRVRACFPFLNFTDYRLAPVGPHYSIYCEDMLARIVEQPLVALTSVPRVFLPGFLCEIIEWFNHYLLDVEDPKFYISLSKLTFTKVDSLSLGWYHCNYLLRVLFRRELNTLNRVSRSEGKQNAWSLRRP